MLTRNKSRSTGALIDTAEHELQRKDKAIRTKGEKHKIELSPVLPKKQRNMTRKGIAASPILPKKQQNTTRKSIETSPVLPEKQRNTTKKKIATSPILPKKPRITSRKHQQTESDSIKSNANNMQCPPNGESSNAEIITCYNAIKGVLTLKYTNVVERLQLSFPAKCTRALKECSQNHTRDAQIVHSDNITASQTFLNNYHPLMYIHVISLDVLQNKFPGASTIQSLFELILGVCESSNDEYNVTNVIDLAAFTIGNVIQKFPPCWSGANAAYRDLITAKKKNLLTDSRELLNNRTLFGDLMHCLESVIQPDTKPISVLIDDSYNDSFNDSHQLLTFQQWESKHAKKYSFDGLKRDDKIDRLFTSLSLFVQLFETDLAMWTIKYNPNPSIKIDKSGKNPLIALILWENEPPQVNYFIKDILKLYVNYININFPLSHTKILGRLVNLIYNIFELREIRLSKDKIEYPQSVQHQSHFCDSLAKIIFDIMGCNISSWLNVIELVEHQRLKLYLVAAVLTKIDHKNVELNPKNIYFSLNRMERECKNEAFSSSLGQNNNVVKKLKSTKINDAIPLKYPCLQKVQRRAITGELTDQQHIQLHLTALNAYINVFHIKEFRNYWKDYDRLKQRKDLDLVNYNDASKSYQNDTVEPFDLRLIEKMQHKSFDSRIRANAHEGYSLDVLNEAVGITEKIEMYADVKKYREDLKFVDMILNGLPKLREHFGPLFTTLD